MAYILFINSCCFHFHSFIHFFSVGWIFSRVLFLFCFCSKKTTNKWFLKIYNNEELLSSCWIWNKTKKKHANLCDGNNDDDQKYTMNLRSSSSSNLCTPFVHMMRIIVSNNNNDSGFVFMWWNKTKSNHHHNQSQRQRDKKTKKD